jgi:hypothetical protein
VAVKRFSVAQGKDNVTIPGVIHHLKRGQGRAISTLGIGRATGILANTLARRRVRDS